MFNNFAKFELPAIRGEELWPDVIRSPVTVRASFEYAPNLNDPPSAEALTVYFHEIIDNETPRILNFLVTQRQNYQVGSTEFTSTLRTVGPLTLHYTNIQGKHEILQLNGQLTPEMYEKLQQWRAGRAIVEPTAIYEAELRRQEEEEEQKKKDVLQLVIFHDDNQISYAPMTELRNPTGRATRRALRSSWGTDILKICQLQATKYFSHIYGSLNGLSTGEITAGAQFALTTNELFAEQLCQSDAKKHYPIMNNKNEAAYVAHSTIVFDQTGRVNGVLPVSSQYSAAGYEFEPFAISENGDRYYGISFTEAMTTQTVIVGGDQFSFVRDYLLSSTNAPYMADFLDQPTQQDSLPADKVGYLAPSGWIWSGTRTDVYGTYSSTTYTSHVDLPMTRVSAMGTLTTVKRAVDSLYRDWENDDPGNVTIGIDYVSIFGDIEIPGFSLSGTLVEAGSWYAPYYDALHIIFPFGQSNWMAIQRTDTKVGGSGDIPIEAHLITDYGYFPGQMDFGSGPYRPSMNSEQYRGWLHIANSDHLLQAFIWNNTRFVFLDGTQQSSILGVPVNDIQGILFDIPLSRVNRFK